MGIDTKLDMMAEEICEEFYYDEVCNVIENNRRVNELYHFHANTEMSAGDLQALAEDEVVDHINVHTFPDDSEYCTKYGLLPFDVFFVNGDSMTVYS